jgi:hypothetical protein
MALHSPPWMLKQHHGAWHYIPPLGFFLYPDWHYIAQSALSHLITSNLPVIQPSRCTCFALAMQNDGIATSKISISKFFESRTSSPACIWLHESALHVTQQQRTTYYGASEPESARRLTQWKYKCLLFDLLGHYRVLVCSLAVSNSHAHATTYLLKGMLLAEEISSASLLTPERRI